MYKVHNLFLYFHAILLYSYHSDWEGGLTLQLKVINSLICLYQEQNISKASAKLYISQQGLSRQIQVLENELNVSLFTRSNSGVEPTEICRVLYPHFKSIYDEYLASQDALENYRKKKNSAHTIAFAYGVANSVSSDFMFEYQRKHPKLNLEIEEWSQATCIEKLVKNELDAAFLVTPIDQRIMHATPLKEGFMYIAMHKTHPLATSSVPIELKSLDGESIITGVPENAIRQIMDYLCNRLGIHLRILVSSSNNLNFINTMKKNIGIAPITQTMAARITNPDIIVRNVILPERSFIYYCTPINAPKKCELSEMQRYVENYFAVTPTDQLLKEN